MDQTVAKVWVASKDSLVPIATLNKQNILVGLQTEGYVDRSVGKFREQHHDHLNPEES